jgi:hypothetical protein
MSLYIEDFNVKDVEALSKNNQNLKITENNCINDYNNYPKKGRYNITIIIVCLLNLNFITDSIVQCSYKLGT